MPDDPVAIRPDKTVRLTVFALEGQSETALRLEQFAESGLLADAWQKMKDDAGLRRYQELPNTDASLAVLENGLHRLSPKFAFLASEIYRGQMQLYFKSFPEIEALDVDVRVEKGPRYFNRLSHVDNVCYQDHPVAVNTMFGWETHIVLREPTASEVMGRGIYLKDEDMPLIARLRKGDIGWMFMGDRSIIHFAPDLEEEDLRVATVMKPSRGSLQRLGIAVDDFRR